MSEENTSKIAELDEAIEKFKSQKRWSDAIRRIIAKSDLVSNNEEKINLLEEAAQMYVEKSNNQAEAIKCFEKILSFDENHEEAISQLKEMYEKRRDWEKLILLLDQEASSKAEDEQLAIFLHAAQLGSDKIRKPDICIELWQKVLSLDPNHTEALEKLVPLFERAKKWEDLAQTIEALTCQEGAQGSQAQPLLQKLATVYGEKLDNNDEAIRTLRRIIDLDPDDKRSIEQLKRRLVANQSWVELEDFLGGLDKWEELARVFDREADQESHSQEDRLSLLFKVADIWKTHLEKPERAVRALEKVIAMDAENLQAAVELISIFDPVKDARKVAPAFEIQLIHLSDEQERLALLKQLGAMYAEKLRQPEAAFEKYEQALRLEPDSVDLRDQLEDLARKEDSLAPKLVQVFKEILEQTPSLSELRLQLAEWLMETGQVEPAIKHFTQTRAELGDELEILQPLADLYRQTENYEALNEVDQALLSLDVDDEKQATLWIEIATLNEKQLSNLPEAENFFRQLLENNDKPYAADQRKEAQQGILRVLQKQEKWSDLSDELERQIAISNKSDEKQLLQFQLAQTQEKHLSETERAIEIYQTLLKENGDFEPALQALKNLSEEGTFAALALEALSSVFEHHARWEALVNTLTQRSEKESDLAQKANFLVQAARLNQTQLNDSNQAYNLWTKAIQTFPTEQTLAEATQLAQETDNLEPFASILIDTADQTSSNQDKLTLYIHAARLLSEQLNKAPQAIGVCEKALVLDDKNEKVLELLAGLYREAEKWEEFILTTTTLIDIDSSIDSNGDIDSSGNIDSSGDDEKIESLLLEVAATYRDQLQDLSSSIQTYRQALERFPQHPEALQSLVALFEEQNQWDDLIDLHRSSVEAASDQTEQASLLNRIGRIKLEKQQKPERAIETLEEVLAIDPQNETALSVLESLLQKQDFQLRICNLLEPIYRASNQFEKLARVLDLKVAQTEQAEEKIDLLNQISELLEVSLDNPNKAYKKTSLAFALRPEDENIRERLERLAGICSEYPSLASVYESSIEKTENIETQVSMLCRAAQIHEENLEQVDSAIALYNQAFALAPENLDTVIQLERLYQATEDFAQLAKMNIIHSDLLADPNESKEFLVQGANIYSETLEDDETAIKTYRRAHEIDPDDLDIVETLIQLYRKTQQWESLIDFLKKKSEQSIDENSRKDALFEIASLYQSQFNDLDQAIVYFQKAAEALPTDVSSLDQLHQLFTRQQKWEDVASILGRKIELSENVEQKIQLQFELAQLLDEKNHKTPQAVEIFKEILESNPSHQPTIAALDALLKRGEETEIITATLEPIYSQEENWSALVSLLDEKAKHEDDALTRAEIFERIAELYQVQLESSDSEASQKAFEYLLRAFKENSNNEENHGALYSLANDLKNWETLRVAYEEEIEKQKTQDTAIASDLAVRAAQIAEDQENEIEKATALYRIVLEIEPEHHDALEALDRLLLKQEKWDELASIIQREIEFSADPDSIAELRFRLGIILIEQLEQRAEGVELFREILASDPEHVRVVSKLETMLEKHQQTFQVAEVLEPFYNDREDWLKLSHVNEVVLSETSDVGDSVAILQKLADIAENKLHNAKGALAWFKRALILQPSSEHLITELERIASQSEVWVLACNAFADAAKVADQTDVKKGLVKRLADIYEDQLQNVELAEETYRYLLSIDSQDEDALIALDRIYSSHGANFALSQVLEKRIAIDPEAHESIEKHFRLGQIFELELDQKEKAVECYKMIVDHLDNQHLDAIQSLAYVYFEQEQWHNLLLAYQSELQASASDEERYEVYTKMATLADEKIGDTAKAIEYWNGALEVAGEDVVALNALGNLHAKSQNWRELSDVLDRESVAQEDEKRRIQIFTDLASVCLYGNHDNERAIENYERVFDLYSQSPDPLIRIAAIQYNDNRFEDAIQTLERALESDLLEDTRQESNLHGFIGYIYFNQLKDLDGAVESYRKATELHSENFGAWDALDFLYGHQNQYDSLIEVYEQRVEILTDTQYKIDQLFVVAKTIEAHAEDTQRSESVYLQILEIDPLNQEAFETLQTRFKEEERWTDLIQLLLNRVQSEPQSETRISILFEAISIQKEKLEDIQAAFETAMLAWSQDYAHEAAIELLESITDACDRWADVLNSANEVLEQDLDSAQEIAICLCCAKWYGQKLGYAEYALPYVQKILETKPNHIQAIRYMRDSYLTLEQWEELIQTLNFLVQISEDPDEISDAYLLIGNTYEQHLSDTEQAFAHYQSAIEHNAQNLAAIDAIETFYEKSGDWNQFLELLLNKVELVENENLLVDTYLKIAETYEDRFNDIDHAIQYFKEAIKANPERMEGIRGLERLYSRGDQWTELAQMLEEHIDAITDPKNQIRMLNQIAIIWEEESNQVEKALAIHQRILEIDPSHENAFLALERIFRLKKQWQPLVETYDQHVDLVSDLKEKKRLFKAATKVFTDELKDYANAIDCCHRALDIDPNDPETLESLANIYEGQHEFEQAIDTLERLVQNMNDTSHRVQLLFRIGKLFEQNLKDLASASDAYRRVTDVDPNFAPALTALQNIYVHDQSWAEAAQVLEAAIQSQKEQNPVETSKLAAKLGHIAKDHLEDSVKALENFELAFELDSTNIEAAFPLASCYFENAQFEKSYPIFKELLSKSDQLDVTDRQQLYFMAGKSASRLGNHEDSIVALQKASKASPNDLDIAMELATAYHSKSDWLNASKIYQSLLVQHKDELEAPQIADLFFRLGLTKYEQKDSVKAIQMLEKALDAYPQHRPATEALVRIYEKKEDWGKAIEYRVRVLRDFIDDPEQQFKLLVKIGTLCQEKLGHVQEAIGFFDEALSIKPDDTKLLHAMLSVYQQGQDWEGTIRIIGKISETNDNAEAKAKYAYTVGVIYRDQLKDIESALTKFNEALDLDIGQLKAFEAINKILTEKKDWKNLERSFRKMIHRIIDKDQKELEFTLWHNLGIIYRDRLNNTESAVEAFSLASKLKPEDETQRVILSELYALIPEKKKQAIAEHQWLLEKNPSRLKSYKALYRLYFDTHQYDKAWCVASALVFFKKADQEQENFVDQYSTADIIRPNAVLNRQVWLQYLALSEEDKMMTKLFEVLAPVVQSIKARSDRALHLQKKYWVKPEEATGVFSKVFHDTGKTYGLLETPRLFTYPDAPGTGLRHKTGSQPFAVECGADLLSGFTPQEVGFTTGYLLGYHRPEAIIRTLVVNRDELKLILLAGLRLAGLDIADSSADATMKTLMDKMKPQQMEVLKEAANQFVQAKSSVNIKTWLRCIDLAITRAAFVMSNNLSAAVKMIGYPGSETISYASSEEKVADLLKYATSDTYFQLRDTLGIKIKI